MQLCSHGCYSLLLRDPIPFRVSLEQTKDHQAPFSVKQSITPDTDATSRSCQQDNSDLLFFFNKDDHEKKAVGNRTERNKDNIVGKWMISDRDIRHRRSFKI